MSGLTHRALRYYEELGLLGDRDHTPGKFRTYSAEDVERLGRIKRLKEVMGLHLSEIKDVLNKDEERRVLLEQAESEGDPGEKRRRLERVREILLFEQKMVKDRREKLREVERRLKKKLYDVDRQLKEL
jgi:DNA-binding transcriptional MerR regulator